MKTPKTRLSQLFHDPVLRAVFARAERDQDPDTFSVPANSPTPPRTDGGIAKKDRELCTSEANGRIPQLNGETFLSAGPIDTLLPRCRRPRLSPSGISPGERVRAFV
jgi:hypothetical protein